MVKFNCCSQNNLNQEKHSDKFKKWRKKDNKQEQMLCCNVKYAAESQNNKLYKQSQNLQQKTHHNRSDLEL